MRVILTLKPASTQSEPIGEGVKFVSAICHEMTPTLAAPLDRLSINIHWHGTWSLMKKCANIMHIMTLKIKQLLDPRALGASIKSKRKTLGYTQKQVADSLEIHPSQVVRIEQGKIATINKSVRKICIFLHITIDVTDIDSRHIAARVERLIRDAPQSTALLRSTVEILEQMLLPRND
ncbi:helix-turn-helix domain-containing protein [Pseudomonas viridiflava]|uniref:helix-turn-helix domain-containing protein n=1 Tax=Pseudomonas viridiflava TaxID=33069 RepID=UPI000F05C73D|nr:helix-turn-helix transcriptional regulator [Pseudomonas viridiflava]